MHDVKKINLLTCDVSSHKGDLVRREKTLSRR